jgi:processive 1,2-diacylglycerol beta-glucosyltransferase
MEVNLTMNGKILILTDRYGNGHLQAANAIQQAIRLADPKMEVMVADFMEFTHPYSYPISRFLFLKGIQRLPSLYGYFFQKTYHHSPYWVHALMKLGLKKMDRWLNQIHPSVVISTSPLAASMMSIMKKHGLNVPTVTVITDHTSHGFWVQSATDLYLVSSEFVRQSLTGLGVPFSCVEVTGIPIRQQFQNKHCRKELIEKYHLHPNVPTILVMGGGEGMLGNGKKLLKQFNLLPERCQIIIVCGHNMKLKRNLDKQIIHSKHRILSTGYVENIDELMSLSDLVITKAGGLTTAEAIALEVPLLLYKSLPGQEQENAKFLLEAGVAIQAVTETDLTAHLTTLLKKPELLQQMKIKTRLVQPKNSAVRAAEIILLLGQSLTNPSKMT